MARVVGVPKEIKDLERRVSMQPDGVMELVHHGHEVVVQAGAGAGSGFTDEGYAEAGARLVDGPEEVFSSADLIVKVKEPVPGEYDRFREGQQLFTYLHLATYVEEGVIHYCVANIPGAVARTSTLALTSVTLSYLIRIANDGVEGVATKDPNLAKGPSTLDGNLVSAPVAEVHGLQHTKPGKISR